MDLVDLNELAVAITKEEGLSLSLSVAQIKEVLAILGRRWRSMPPEEAALEIMAIVERGGAESEHTKDKAHKKL